MTGRFGIREYFHNLLWIKTKAALMLVGTKKKQISVVLLNFFCFLYLILVCFTMI